MWHLRCRVSSLSPSSLKENQAEAATNINTVAATMSRMIPDYDEIAEFTRTPQSVVECIQHVTDSFYKSVVGTFRIRENARPASDVGVDS